MLSQQVLLVDGRGPRFVVSFEPRLLCAAAQLCLPWPFIALLGGEKLVRYRANVWSRSVSGYKEAYDSSCMSMLHQPAKAEGKEAVGQAALRLALS